MDLYVVGPNKISPHPCTRPTTMGNLDATKKARQKWD